MIEPVIVYSEDDHGDAKDWRNYLIHPIRSYWGDGTLEWDKWEKHFDFYKSIFVLSDKPQNADVAFLPFTLNYYSKHNKINLFKNFLVKMHEFGKKVFVWVEGDFDVEINYPNCTFIKYSGYKSKVKSNFIIQPGDLKYDLLDEYYGGKLQLLDKKSVPSVGFVGLADYSHTKLVLSILKESLCYLRYFFPRHNI